MNHLNFRHEMSSNGFHRIVETVSNTEGSWVNYANPAFLKIDDRTFAVFTQYFASDKELSNSFPPVETVFEILTMHTEHAEVEMNLRAKYLT